MCRLSRRKSKLRRIGTILFSSLYVLNKRSFFSNNVLTHDRESFRSSYAGSPPWDIGKPQPAFQAAADKVVGSVLHAGCGTGEHALFFAAWGHPVTGFDFLEEPIAAARRKAAERSLVVKFLVKDALKLHVWTECFDNVLDSGLFHVFSDEDRIHYVRGLKTVLNPDGRLFLLCFSDATPGQKDRDGSRSPSCAMPLPMAGKSNPSSPCASKSAQSIEREPSPAKIRAAGSSSPAAWLKRLGPLYGGVLGGVALLISQLLLLKLPSVRWGAAS